MANTTEVVAMPWEGNWLARLGLVMGWRDGDFELFVAAWAIGNGMLIVAAILVILG